MLSRLQLPIDLTKNMVGYVVEKKDPAPEVGESLKLYIPTLMPNLKKSLPVDHHIVQNTSNSKIVNFTQVKPTTKLTFKCQNFLTGVLRNNATWDHVSSFKKENRDAKNKDSYELTCIGTDSNGGTISTRIIESYNVYKTEGDEKVSCNFINGKISKLLFNTNNYLNE